MRSDDVSYFAEESRLINMEKAANRLEVMLNGLSEDVSDKLRYKLRLICVAFTSIKNDPSLFDSRCQFNIEGLGDRYVASARHLDPSNLEDLSFMFCASYRFLLEFQIGSPFQASDDILEVVGRVHDYEYSGNTRSQLKYAEHQMMVSIMRSYIHHPGMVTLKSLPEQVTRAEVEREKSSLDLDEREQRVQALREKLETYKTAFNFCGLYDGFKHLRESKRVEGYVGLVVLLVLALLMMCPFLIKFYLVFFPLEGVVLDNQFYIALLGFELVLAYFFRVALHNYRSVKAQLIQIDLRMTLCQFVQDYARYAKEVHAGSPNLLERFEQIVFSGIVNDEGAIPSTFDGLESLAAVISKIKK